MAMQLQSLVRMFGPGTDISVCGYRILESEKISRFSDLKIHGKYKGLWHSARLVGRENLLAAGLAGTALQEPRLWNPWKDPEGPCGSVPG